MTKRKNKNIIMSHEAHRYLQARLHREILPYKPIIIDKKRFVTIIEEVKEKDDSRRER